MAKSLIVVATELGVTAATTSAGLRAMRTGVAPSGRLFVVGAWAREVVRRYNGEDLGVDLVLLSPRSSVLGFRPLTYAPTLMGGEGTFPSTIEDLCEHADASEVYGELRAQVERAILWGIPVSHIALPHEAAWPRADLADVIFTLAEEFHLILRLTPAYDETTLGYDAHAIAASRNIPTIDHILSPTWGDFTSTQELIGCIISEFDRVERGQVTEIGLTFADDTPELRAYTHRIAELQTIMGLLDHHAEFTSRLQELGIELRSYRDLLIPTGDRTHAYSTTHAKKTSHFPGGG